VTLDSQVRLVQLGALDHRDPMVRLDSQEFKVHRVTQDPLERPDNQETQVFRVLPEIRDLQEELVLLVNQALSVPRVNLV